MKKAIYLAQLITNAHPESVRLLFQANGINKPVSAKSIIDAYLVLGEPFLHKLFEIVWNGMSNFSGIEGLEVDKLTSWANTQVNSVDGAKAKTNFWDGFKNVFNTAGDILGGVAGAYDSVSGILNGGKVNAPSGSEAELELQKLMYQQQLLQQQQAASDKTKTYLLIGSASIVVILVAIMFLKK